MKSHSTPYGSFHFLYNDFPVQERFLLMLFTGVTDALREYFLATEDHGGFYSEASTASFFANALTRMNSIFLMEQPVVRIKDRKRNETGDGRADFWGIEESRKQNYMLELKSSFLKNEGDSFEKHHHISDLLNQAWEQLRSTQHDPDNLSFYRKKKNPLTGYAVVYVSIWSDHKNPDGHADELAQRISKLKFGKKYERPDFVYVATPFFKDGKIEPVEYNDEFYSHDAIIGWFEEMPIK